MAQKDNEIFNETTNTFAGITTPVDQQDCAATDMISEAVEEIMDNIQHDFQPATKQGNNK